MVSKLWLEMVTCADIIHKFDIPLSPDASLALLSILAQSQLFSENRGWVRAVLRMSYALFTE